MVFPDSTDGMQQSLDEATAEWLGSNMFITWNQWPGGHESQHVSQGHWFFTPRARAFVEALRKDLETLPVRRLVSRLTANDLGVNATHRDRSAC